LIFKLLDFDEDGYIIPADIKLLINFIFLNSGRDINEIDKIISSLFLDLEKLDQNEFVTRIKNFNSDIYYIIYVYILDNAPFNENCLNVYKYDIDRAVRKKLTTGVVTCISDQSLNTLKSSHIASPTRRIRMAMKSIIQKHEIFEDSDEEGLRDLTDEKWNIRLPNLSAKSISDIDTKNKKLVFNTDINIYKNRLYDSLDAEIHKYYSNSNINGIKYETYIYKFEQKENVLRKKKYWVALVNFDLFFFKDKEKIKIKRVHHMSDAFVSDDIKDYEFYDRTFYYFSLFYFKKKENIFFTKTSEEAKNWVKNIKSLLNQRNIKNFYKFCDLIGKGGFASVYLSENRDTKEEVAIKIFNKNNGDEKSVELVKTEIEILRCCRHDNILSYIDYFEDHENIYLVSEFMDSGDLTDLLKYQSLMDENKIKALLRQIGSGLKYLHEYGIIHRDLKPQNILVKRVDNLYKFKIADFGLSKVIGYNETTTECLGTIYFSPPEIIKKAKYNNKVDIWSLGIILYFLIYGTIPNAKEENANVIAKKICFENIELPNFRSISNECKDLLLKSLRKEHEQRIGINEFLSHGWFDI
jgi:tRNA A-37 threonylcarbamoyl transferase component Bud32